jgi:DMSO/TMAO reductase YedYZ molybdopterin-dependent catalytic subunit
MTARSSREARRLALESVDRAVHELESSGAENLDRRRLLRIGASSLAAALLSACGLAGNDRAERVLGYASRKNEGVEEWLLRHTSIDHPSSDAAIAGNRFPSYFVSGTMPVWSRNQGEWTLEVAGLVRTPLRLNLQGLMALPSITHRVDHFCVEGWNAVAKFTGVRVSELARLAGALPQAAFVDFHSFDSDYHESWDIESATHPQTLIVYAKDSQSLTPAYGAPARVHSPVKLGYKNTKYLTRVEFMARRNGGYWTDRGYEWYGGTCVAAIGPW